MRPLLPYRPLPVPAPRPSPTPVVIDAEYEPAILYPRPDAYQPPLLPYCPPPPPHTPAAYSPPPQVPLPAPEPPRPADYAPPPPAPLPQPDRSQRWWLAGLLLAAALLAGLYLGRQPSSSLAGSWGAHGAGTMPHYPSILDIQKAGGFFHLPADQQAIVRHRYVQELQLFLEQSNQRMQIAQYSGDLAACYAYRTLIRQLQNSLARAQNASYDPTAEHAVIQYVSVALAG